MSSSVKTKSSAGGEQDLALIVRVTKDIEQKLADAIGVTAPRGLFKLIEEARDCLSEIAVNHAHALRLIRNDLAHGEARCIAQSPNAKWHRTHKAVRLAHAYVVAEIEEMKANPRPVRRHNVPARSWSWLHAAAVGLLVVGGWFASQFFGG